MFFFYRDGRFLNRRAAVFGFDNCTRKCLYYFLKPIIIKSVQSRERADRYACVKNLSAHTRTLLKNILSIQPPLSWRVFPQTRSGDSMIWPGIQMRIAVLAALVVCTSVLGDNKPETSEAPSKTSPKAGSVDKHYLAIITRGGSSLGAYEGGYNYYLTEWLKKNQKKFEVKIITGTSAGSINALLDFVTLADSTPIGTPENSIFYIAWSRIGFDRIRGPDTRLGFLGRLGLRSVGDTFGPPEMKKANTAYDMLLGITATHISAVNQEVTHGLDVPTVKQRFVVRGMVASDCTWSCRNYIDPSAGTETPVLPLKKRDTVNAYWHVLYNLALASVSIPGLFRPLPLEHLQIVPSKLSNEYKKALADSNDPYGILLAARTGKTGNPLDQAVLPKIFWSYVDGGIFDASPIRLAFQLAHNAFNDKGEIKDVPTWGLKHVDTCIREPDFHYFFISPQQTIFPPLQKQWTFDSASIAEVLFGAVCDWVQSAANNELFTLKEEYPGLEGKLHLSRNYYPTFSRLLGQTFGFLETDIRIFDFYLGMYDAEKYLNGDFRDQFKDDNLQEPKITSCKFETIRAIFDSCQLISANVKNCDNSNKSIKHCPNAKERDKCRTPRGSIDSTDANFKRLVVLSRELYLQYWRTPEGLAQKRECAKKIIAAFLGKGSESTRAAKKLEDSLENSYHVHADDFHAFHNLADMIFKREGETGYVDTAARLDLALEYIQKFHQSYATKAGVKAESSPAGCILGYKLPLLEHYLEASLNGCGKYLPQIVSQNKLHEVQTKLCGINDSTELEKILDCVNTIGFKYTDIPLLENNWRYNGDSGKWVPEGHRSKPECMSSEDVMAKIHTALSGIFADYSDINGGPEIERVVVNFLGKPAISLISKRRPRGILYGSIVIPAGLEIGTSLKLGCDCLRLNIDVNNDSLDFGKIIPEGQGVGLSYNVPMYLQVGPELEFLRIPMVQCRVGLNAGLNLRERSFHDGDYKAQVEVSISLVERIRISLSLATKARTWEDFAEGVMPAFSFGGEFLHW
jgi:Patatin-like phospholipase